jgi:hypothetical protein
MKSLETLKEALGLLWRLAADDDLFGQEENAQQFALGAAAALHWALGEDQAFSGMLACARTKHCHRSAKQMTLNDTQ